MTRRRARGLRQLLLGILAGLLAACEKPPPATPRFTELSARFEPADLTARARAWHAAAGLPADAFRDVEAGIEVRHAIPDAAWSADGPGAWSAPWPGGAFDHGFVEFLKLEAVVRNAGEEQGRSWRTTEIERPGDRLRVRARQEGDGPPTGATLVQRIEQGRREPGGTRWQLRANTFYGNGIPVWSDAPVELTCDLRAHARLSFGTRFLGQASAGTVTFRVRLDGETVHESTLAPGRHVAGAEQSAVLPPGARPGARITLEVDGAAGQGLFTHPVIGPAEFGSYGKRPWSDAQPDVVLFLADTFRADNLALHGGDASWTPELNAFAATSTAFTQARSVAAWTLPAVSSLMTGLWPAQHTAEDDDRALPLALTTIAERLAAAGYRTCAVTDSGYVVQAYNLDQGFESFHQISAQSWDLDLTLAVARGYLDADDGRPLFLFVHTYRAHIPYRVGPDETLARYAALAKEHPLVNRKEHMDPELYERSLAASVDEYRALYRAGVQDLDRGFGELRADLARRGVLADGLLVFTSDHGEALGENDEIFHDGDLWETKLRVPLLLHGPGFGWTVDDTPVSLVDLAPTLARFAWVESDPAWVGRPLGPTAFGKTTGPGAAARPLFAFRSRETTLKQIALVENGHKVLAREVGALARGDCTEAYDLTVDPGELTNVCGGAAWPAELAREHSRAIDAATQERVTSETTTAPAELSKIGYGQDDR